MCCLNCIRREPTWRCSCFMGCCSLIAVMDCDSSVPDELLSLYQNCNLLKLFMFFLTVSSLIIHVSISTDWMSKFWFRSRQIWPKCSAQDIIIFKSLMVRRIWIRFDSAYSISEPYPILKLEYLRYWYLNLIRRNSIIRIRCESEEIWKQISYQ